MFSLDKTSVMENVSVRCSALVSAMSGRDVNNLFAAIMYMNYLTPNLNINLPIEETHGVDIWLS
jgi:hypothetical protein